MALFTLILATLGLAQAGPWDQRTLQILPNALALETAMERAKLTPRSASALYGASMLGSRMDGSPVDIAALGWMRLDGVTVVDPAETRGVGERRSCAKVRGHDPVPGGRRIVPVRNRLKSDSEPGDRPPTLILANGDAGEVALLQLQPGDVLQITDVEHKGNRMEHIEVRRGAQLLTVDRRGAGAHVCYEPDVNRPAEWLPD